MKVCGREKEYKVRNFSFFITNNLAFVPPSLLYNEYQVFPEGKVRPGRAADHSPPYSAVVIEE